MADRKGPPKKMGEKIKAFCLMVIPLAKLVKILKEIFF